MVIGSIFHSEAKNIVSKFWKECVVCADFVEKTLYAVGVMTDVDYLYAVASFLVIEDICLASATEFFKMTVAFFLDSCVCIILPASVLFCPVCEYFFYSCVSGLQGIPC